MIEKTVTTASGLSARSAALFVQLASKFISKIQIKVEHKLINAKSIMGVLSIGILAGQTVTVIAEGDDREEAISELTLFLLGTQLEM